MFRKRKNFKFHAVEENLNFLYLATCQFLCKGREREEKIKE